jgi:hypothetical protein
MAVDIFLKQCRHSLDMMLEAKAIDERVGIEKQKEGVNIEV